MALITCPDCGHQVSDVAIACINCGRPITAARSLPPEIQTPVASRPEAIGTALIALPWVAVLLMVFLGVTVPLIDGRAGYVNLISWIVVPVTAMLASIDVARVPIAARPPKSNRPGIWFVALLLLWVIAYPWYLHKRGTFGYKRHGIIGIITAVVFLAALVLCSMDFNQLAGTLPDQ